MGWSDLLGTFAKGVVPLLTDSATKPGGFTQNLAQGIGPAMGNIANQALGSFTGQPQQSTGSMGDFFRNMAPSIGNMAGQALGGIANRFSGNPNSFMGKIAPAIGGLAPGLGNMAGNYIANYGQPSQQPPSHSGGQGLLDRFAPAAREMAPRFGQAAGEYLGGWAANRMSPETQPPPVLSTGNIFNGFGGINPFAQQPQYPGTDSYSAPKPSVTIPPPPQMDPRFGFGPA